MSFLFGGKPSKPVVQTVKPIEKIVQSDEEQQATMKSLSKRKKATVLNQLSQANISRQTLGAA